MKWKISLAAISIVAVLLSLNCTHPTQITGNGSGTGNAVAAMLYNPDYTPAVGAVVRFFVATDSTRTIAYQTTTDTNGRYSTKGLAKGMYNMLAYSAKGLAKGTSKLLATNDSLIAYQDSILVLADTVLVQPDTLEKPGSITGIIGLQPNHDPRTATVQVLGTDLYSNVDINGRFTLAPVAKGSYNLRLVTTLADYTPTYVTIQTAGQKKDTLSDTLWLLYTGIPVVTGLAATYDTVNGVVRLSWNKAAYRDFQKYLIFRDAYDSIVLSTIPIAASGDTFFVDSIYKRNVGSGQFSFSDTNDYHFQYRVCIQNNSTIRGETYKYIGIVAASPKKVETSFAFRFFHIAKQFVTDSASVNDSLLCSVKLANPTRQLRSLVWTDVVTGKTVRTVSLDSTKKTANDSLVYSWNSVGTKGLGFAVTDMAGTVWKDTADISIVTDAPVVKMTYSPAIIAVNDTVHFHVTANRKYGKIVKVEWDIGNTGLFTAGTMKDSVADTAVVAPGVPDTGWACVAKVTDDDGNVVLDSVKMNVGMFKLATDSTGFIYRTGHSSVVFNNMMWVIGGSNGRYGAFSDVWNSKDGISWLCATQQVSFPLGDGAISLAFNSNLWVIGGYFNSVDTLGYVWFSSDGISWSSSTSAAQFPPRYGHTCLVFNNKMWVIGGTTFATVGTTFPVEVYNNVSDIWYSSDGATWIQAAANAGFSPRSRHSSVVFDNRMWVIAGEDNSGYKSDVWYSTDGVSWTQATADAGFSPRSAHSSVVYGNKMWVLAGSGKNTVYNDAWYSTDGITWIQATSNTGFSPRAGHSSVVFGNKMWVISGDTCSDVWYSNFSGK